MANTRQADIKPMPFPGESPTVALAMAAGQKYGLNEKDGKPARKANPKRRAAAAKKKPAKQKSPARRTRKPAKSRAR